MTTDTDRAAVLAQLAETEARMTPGEWSIGRTDMTTEVMGENGEWHSVHYVYRPGSDPSETGGEWLPRIGVMGDDCRSDAAGIAALRNAAPALLAVAEAAAKYVGAYDAWDPLAAEPDAGPRWAAMTARRAELRDALARLAGEAGR